MCPPGTRLLGRGGVAINGSTRHPRRDHRLSLALSSPLRSNTVSRIRTDPKAAVHAALQLARRFPIDTMAGRLVRFHRWLVHDQCRIRDIHEQVIALRPNRAQYMLLATWFAQALLSLPIRCVILKARKVGVSTFIQAWRHFNCRFYPAQNAIMMAHKGDDTRMIFRITATIAKHDPLGGIKIGRQMIEYPNGSIYSCQTAGSESAGAGGTPNLLHRSELALWPHTKKSEADYTSGDAVPMTPTSCIDDESTARGQDLFWARFRAADAPDHPYQRLFVPWFVDDTLQADLPPRFEYDADELDIMTRARSEYGIEISDRALAWRRLKLRELQGSIELFRQEYPSTAEEAIRSRGGLVLPGLAECVIDRLPFDTTRLPDREKTGGYDYGFRDPTVLITAYYRDQVLYVSSVYRAVGRLPEDYIREGAPGHLYYCDPSDPGVMEQLHRAMRKVGSAARYTPAPRATGTREGSIVRHEWDIVRGWIADGRIRILRRASEQLILEADSLEWDEQKQEPNMTRTAECGHYDTLCALRYAVMGCATGVAPIRKRLKRNRPRMDLRRV